MKSAIRFLFVLSVLTALALLVGIVVSAQGPSTYASTFQLQNLASSEANVTIRFYEQDGDVAVTITDTIVADGSNTYFAVTVPGLPSTFEGSAVVESDQPIRAISSLYADNFAFGGASALGYTSGSEEINLPLIMRNNSGYSTWFSVQNAGSATASVSITYTAGPSGSDYTPSAVSIPAGASATFDQSDITQLGSKFIGSAQLVGTQPIVATAVEVGPTTLFAYDAFTSSDPIFVVPLFHFNNSGYSSSINVQNTGAADTTVTVSYSPSSNPAGGTYGTACQETQTVAAGSAATFGWYAFVPSDPPGAVNYSCDCYTKNPGTRFIGSAEVTTNTGSQNLVAVVNQLNSAAGKASAYNAYGPDDGTQCVSAPLVMDRNSNYWTSINIVNAGSASTTVTIEYSPNGKTSSPTYGQTPDDDVVELDAGESMSILHTPAGNPILDNYVGSARICGANSSDELLVIVNELNTVASGDTLYTYNGLNLE